jgi:HSP20 family protein
VYIYPVAIAQSTFKIKVMAYNFQASHPLIEVFGSFLDGADYKPMSYGTRCEGGPYGRNAPFRHHSRRPRTETSHTFVPAADIYSTDGEYKVYLSLPSADKESIELSYDPNTRELSVSGTLVRPSAFAELDEEALKNVLIQAERKTGKFERKLKIPQQEGERIRFEEAAAKFENGVLELTLPKVEKEGAKKIVID